jgi:putative IMPACT (imprinted ancient) family translation regulator
MYNIVWANVMEIVQRYFGWVGVGDLGFVMVVLSL